jgi:hypothetical protein
MCRRLFALASMVAGQRRAGQPRHPRHDHRSQDSARPPRGAAKLLCSGLRDRAICVQLGACGVESTVFCRGEAVRGFLASKTQQHQGRAISLDARGNQNAPQQAIKNLGTAFKNFFAGTGKYPQFKKKGQHESFRADNGQDKRHPNAVEVKGKRVKLPVIGRVKMREALGFDGKTKSAVVSRTADRWFVSLTVEIEHVAPIRKNQAVVGVDLGVKALATLLIGH